MFVGTHKLAKRFALSPEHALDQLRLEIECASVPAAISSLIRGVSKRSVGRMDSADIMRSPRPSRYPPDILHRRFSSARC